MVPDPADVVAGLTKQARLVRNRAAHDYDLDYQAIAEHFNTREQLGSDLFATAASRRDYLRTELDITPATNRAPE